MELKFANLLYFASRWWVLIVPLWNWNQLARDCFILSFCFNRTFMELKSCCSYCSSIASTCFNRTFMELKSVLNPFWTVVLLVLIVPLWNWNYEHLVSLYEYFGFNRTFMELKYRQKVGANLFCAVLIVPLWNWNKLAAAEIPLALCFNRTFMELKFIKNNNIIGTVRSFNRTFMELKYWH